MTGTGIQAKQVAQLKSAPAFWSPAPRTEFSAPTALHLYDLKKKPIEHFLISPEQWTGESSLATKLGLLQVLQQANDLDEAKEKTVGCYTGTPRTVFQIFFQNQKWKDENIEVSQAFLTESPDSRMMGVEVHLTLDGGKTSRFLFFRLQSCLMIVTSPDEGPVKHEKNKWPGDPKKLVHLPSAPPSEDGFAPHPALRMDYEHAATQEHSRPWQGLDVRKTEDAQKLALLLQKYFYEGMADQDFNPNRSPRYWCNMPWENVGPQKREPLHGFITGRPLMKNFVYPKSASGSNWGASYLNARACQALELVFGGSSQRKLSPDWRPFAFPDDGTVIAKIHFTEADFPDLKGAFELTTQVHSPYARVFGPHRLRHYQMDIAVKDREILGAKKENNFWVMTTYYFDPSYIAKDFEARRFPEALRHMRPMGIQFGFEAKESLVFESARTNSDSGFLSGPADTSKASCLSCHATAGTTAFLVPGITSYGKTYRDHGLKGLDYSLSLQHALNLYFTRPRQNSAPQVR